MAEVRSPGAEAARARQRARDLVENRDTTFYAGVRPDKGDKKLEARRNKRNRMQAELSDIHRQQTETVLTTELLLNDQGGPGDEEERVA